MEGRKDGEWVMGVEVGEQVSCRWRAGGKYIWRGASWFGARGGDYRGLAARGKRAGTLWAASGSIELAGVVLLG